MKKIVSILLAVCLLLSGTALCEAAETTEAEQSASELHSIRYYFEHKLIPNEFYTNAGQFIPFIRENGLFRMWWNFTQSNGLDLYYTEEQFSALELPREDGLFLMLLTFPKPESDLLCSRIWLCRDPRTDKAGVFTAEMDLFMGENWFLCGWTPKGTHKNFGSAVPLPDPSDTGYREALDAEAVRVVELFRTGALDDPAE